MNQHQAPHLSNSPGRCYASRTTGLTSSHLVALAFASLSVHSISLTIHSISLNALISVLSFSYTRNAPTSLGRAQASTSSPASLSLLIVRVLTVGRLPSQVSLDLLSLHRDLPSL